MLCGIYPAQHVKTATQPVFSLAKNGKTGYNNRRCRVPLLCGRFGARTGLRGGANSPETATILFSSTFIVPHIFPLDKSYFCQTILKNKPNSRKSGGGVHCTPPVPLYMMVRTKEPLPCLIPAVRRGLGPGSGPGSAPAGRRTPKYSPRRYRAAFRPG